MASKEPMRKRLDYFQQVFYRKALKELDAECSGRKVIHMQMVYGFLVTKKRAAYKMMEIFCEAVPVCIVQLKIKNSL
jgi:hypothetical protein